MSSVIVNISAPDILIQDPANQCAYLIPGDVVYDYRVMPEDLIRIGAGAITFVIPEDNYFEEVPPYRSNPEVGVAVLIQYPAGEVSFYLTLDQLQIFKVEQPTEHEGYGISFVMPTGMELIEELPPLMRAMLQSGESCYPGPICDLWGVGIDPVSPIANAAIEN